MTTETNAGASLRASEFSATDAAFAGFSLLRRHPMLLLVWGGATLAYSLLVQALALGPMSAQLGAMRELTTAGATADPAALGRAFASAAPLYALGLGGGLLFYGVLNAAVYRAILRPEERRAGYLRLGIDEVLQVAMLVIWALIIVLLTMITSLIGGIVAVVGTLGVGQGGGAGGAVLLTLLMMVLVFGVLIWFGVKFSLAFPLTFDTRRLQLFSALRLSRGRFWSLFGTYALTWIIALLISLVMLVVAAAVGVAFGGGLGGLGAMLRPDTVDVARLFTPAALVTLVLGALVQAVQWALLAGAPAHAYAQLRGTRVADVF